MSIEPRGQPVSGLAAATGRNFYASVWQIERFARHVCVKIFYFLNLDNHLLFKGKNPLIVTLQLGSR